MAETLGVEALGARLDQNKQARANLLARRPGAQQEKLNPGAIALHTKQLGELDAETAGLQSQYEKALGNPGAATGAVLTAAGTVPPWSIVSSYGAKVAPPPAAAPAPVLPPPAPTPAPQSVAAIAAAAPAPTQGVIPAASLPVGAKQEWTPPAAPTVVPTRPGWLSGAGAAAVPTATPPAANASFVPGPAFNPGAFYGAGAHLNLIVHDNAQKLAAQKQALEGLRIGAQASRDTAEAAKAGASVSAAQQYLAQNPGDFAGAAAVLAGRHTGDKYTFIPGMKPDEVMVGNTNRGTAALVKAPLKVTSTVARGSDGKNYILGPDGKPQREATAAEVASATKR